MKILQLLFLTAFILGAVSCGDDDEPTPIRVGFSFAPENPIAGETVTFTNASTGGTTFAWDFGDGNTSTDENPTHIFESDGTFTVTLVVDNVPTQSFSDDVVVGAPTPEITFSPDPIQTGVATTFSASVYNPSGATVVWTWDFPAEGWISDDLDETGAATAETVTVTFTEANPSLPVAVTASLNGDELPATTNVAVSAQLAKTLWLAQKGGNIWSKQIFAAGEAQLEDSGIPAGSHPLTMDFENDRLYVFDAGSTITFSADPEATPGQIFSFAHDLTAYTTHVTFSNQNYDDAFFGSVDGTDIIFTDRNNDITIMPTSTTDLAWGDNGATGNHPDFPPLVTNNQLAYYSANAPAEYTGPTYGWGALNGTVMRIGDVYWWGKNSNHKGLYRFSAEDIGSATIPEEGAILGTYEVRAFDVDQENAKVYFSSNKTAIGFYVADANDGANVTLIDDSPVDGEGGGNEYTYITDIVVDNESGYVYWAYRGPADADLELNPLHASGIKRYKLDGTGEVEYFIEGVEAYGLALDNTKR